MRHEKAKKWSVVEIRDGTNGPHISLEAIARLLEPEARHCKWRLLYLQGVANGRVLDRDVIELEAEVHRSSAGLSLAWSDVTELAKAFTDLWDIVLVGSVSDASVTRAETRAVMYEKCDFVVERIDSTEWLIFSRHERVRSRLTQGLPTARIAEMDADRLERD